MQSNSGRWSKPRREQSFWVQSDDEREYCEAEEYDDATPLYPGAPVQRRGRYSSYLEKDKFLPWRSRYWLAKTGQGEAKLIPTS